MMVKRLKIKVQLHETNTTFNETTSDQTSPTIGISGLLLQSVHCLRRCRFLVEIERIGSRQLHPRCQFVTCNSSSEFRV